MARSVDDVALLLDVLAMPDHRDPSSLPLSSGTYREAVRRDVRGLRAAYSPALGYLDVDPEITQLVASVVAVLGEAGLTVEEADPGFTDPIEAFGVLWSTGAAKWLDSFPEGSDTGSTPTAQGMGMTHLLGRTTSRHRRTHGVGHPMGSSTPTRRCSPDMPAAVRGGRLPPGSGLTDWPQWTGFTYPFNMTQQPAVSVPAGFTSQGLPVGLQIVGPRHSDDLVLAVARLVEELRPWPTGRPTRSRD